MARSWVGCSVLGLSIFLPCVANAQWQVANGPTLPLDSFGSSPYPRVDAGIAMRPDGDLLIAANGVFYTGNPTTGFSPLPGATYEVRHPPCCLPVPDAFESQILESLAVHPDGAISYVLLGSVPGQGLRPVVVFAGVRHEGELSFDDRDYSFQVSPLGDKAYLLRQHLREDLTRGYRVTTYPDLTTRDVDVSGYQHHISPQSMTVDGDGNQHVVYWGCGGICYRRTMVPAGPFSSPIGVVTTSDYPARRVGYVQDVAQGDEVDSPQIVVDTSRATTAFPPRRFAVAWKSSPDLRGDYLWVAVGTTSADGPSVTSGPTRLAGLDGWEQPNALLSMAMNGVGEIMILYNQLLFQGRFNIRDWRGTEVGWTSEFLFQALGAPNLLKVVSYPGRLPFGLLATVPEASGLRTWIARTAPVISGQVSLGSWSKMPRMRVSLEDSTPAGEGGPKPVRHIVKTGSIDNSVTTPVVTNSLGTYSFTLDLHQFPAPVLPLRVKVTFEMAAADETFGSDEKRSAIWLLPGGTSSPWVRRKVPALGTLNFNFLDEALSKELSLDLGDVNFAAVNLLPDATPASSLPRRLSNLATTYLAMYDGLVEAPARLPNLVVYDKRHKLNVFGVIDRQKEAAGPGAYKPLNYCHSGQPPVGVPGIDLGRDFFDKYHPRVLDITVLHELAHGYMNASFGCYPLGRQLDASGNPVFEVAHLGYKNPSTTSSWTEGYASYMAVLLRTQVLNLDDRPELNPVFGEFSGPAPLQPYLARYARGVYQYGGFGHSYLELWPEAGQYQKELDALLQDERAGLVKNTGREEWRVAGLLWKMTNQSGPGELAKVVNTDLIRLDPKADFADRFSVSPDLLLSSWRSGYLDRNPLDQPLMDHPWDLYAIYQGLRPTLTPTHATPAAFDRLFIGHGMFYDENGSRLHDPGRADLLGFPLETLGRAAHRNALRLPDRPDRRAPAVSVPGTELEFDPIHSSVDMLVMDVIFDPPFEDLSYRIDSFPTAPGRINVELPPPHYSARAFIMAAATQSFSSDYFFSVPLVLTTQQFSDLVASRPAGSDTFYRHSFVWAYRAGHVGGTPTATVLGAGARGTMVEVRGAFSGTRPYTALTYSWSSPGAIFEDPTAQRTIGEFPPGERLVTVYVCNQTGLCISRSLTIQVPLLADTVAPTISCPGDAIVEGGDAVGAPVTFASPVATDDRDPSPLVTCSHASSSVFGYGTTDVLCDAADSAGNTASCSFRITVRDATPPVLHCPADVRVDGTGPGGAFVEPGAATATDLADPHPLVLCDRVSGEMFSYGDTLVACTAVDFSGNRSACSFAITVIDTPPRLSLLGPRSLTVECGSAYDEPGFEAIDARDGDLTSRVQISQVGDTGTVGNVRVEYTVADTAGNRAVATRDISVVDSIPPALTVTATPSVLWPPNHKMVSVELAVTVSDRCDPRPTFRLIQASSNEPANASGDGNTSTDIIAAVGAATTTVQLRAERQGGGSGRTYALTYAATDASNNQRTGSASVIVPDSQGR